MKTCVLLSGLAPLALGLSHIPIRGHVHPVQGLGLGHTPGQDHVPDQDQDAQDQDHGLALMAATVDLSQDLGQDPGQDLDHDPSQSHVEGDLHHS